MLVNVRSYLIIDEFMKRNFTLTCCLEVGIPSDIRTAFAEAQVPSTYDLVSRDQRTSCAPIFSSSPPKLVGFPVYDGHPF